MKRFSLLNIFVFSLLITSLYSCGGSNSTDAGGSDDNVSNNPVTGDISGATSGATNFDDFIDEVRNGNFREFQYQNNYYGQSNTDSAAVRYYKSSNSSNDQSFSEWLEGAFDFDTCSGYQDCQDMYNQNQGIRYIDGDEISRSSGFAFDEQFGDSLVDVKERLVHLMEDAQTVEKCDHQGVCYSVDNWFVKDVESKIFSFEVSNGDQFMVNLNYPLAANPVMMYDKGSDTIYSL